MEDTTGPVITAPDIAVTAPELTKAFSALGVVVWAEHTQINAIDAAFNWIQNNLRFEVGEIYEDAFFRRYIRRADPDWPWAIVSVHKGDSISSADIGTVYPEDAAERPLRHLVPEK